MSISRKKHFFFSESCGLLNLLKKKRPGRVPDNPEIKASNDGDHNKSGSSANATLEIANTNNNNNTSGGSADLLGLGEKINTMRRELNPKFSREFFAFISYRLFFVKTFLHDSCKKATDKVL